MHYAMMSRICQNLCWQNPLGPRPYPCPGDRPYHLTAFDFYPMPCMCSEGSSDWDYMAYILYIVSAKKFLKLKKYSLSEVHFNTGRLLFEFNGLQYRFAAGQVFMAFANPVSVSWVKHRQHQRHKHCSSKPHTLR